MSIHYFASAFRLTISLFALDFYRVIVDEGAFKTLSKSSSQTLQKRKEAAAFLLTSTHCY